MDFATSLRKAQDRYDVQCPIDTRTGAEIELDAAERAAASRKIQYVHDALLWSRVTAAREEQEKRGQSDCKRGAEIAEFQLVLGD